MVMHCVLIDDASSLKGSKIMITMSFILVLNQSYQHQSVNNKRPLSTISALDCTSQILTEYVVFETGGRALKTEKRKFYQLKRKIL